MAINLFSIFQHRSEIRKIEGNNIKSVHVDASNLVKPNEMTKVLIEITNGKKWDLIVILITFAVGVDFWFRFSFFFSSN